MVARAALLLKRDRVYLVQCPQDDSVRLALSVHSYQDELRWYDTVRVRSQKGTLTSRSATGLVWKSADGAIYKFTELTLDSYNLHVRPHVELSLNFRNTDEVHRYYYQKFGPEAGLPPPAPTVHGLALNPMALGARSLAKKAAKKKR